ncbi:MAG: sulfotransferase [Bacteroidota bacterium]
MLFIASPVRRSGTTLLQRLCSASGEALIFGETAAGDLLSAAAMFQAKQHTIRYNAEWRDNHLAEVLAGQVNQWIPDVLPEVDAYLAIHGVLLHLLCGGFARAAATHGRSRWGVKLPEWPIQNLLFWQQLLPASKTIYIVRDHDECLASALKMGIVQEQDRPRFRQVYDQYLAQARQHLLPDQTYFLNYTDLLGNKGPATLKALASFTGLSELPESVLAVRVGNYPRH